MWDKYGKSIVAFLFTVYTVVAPLFFGDHHIDGPEWVIIVLAVANNVLVYIIPLKDTFRGAKTAIYMILAGAAVAQTLVLDGLQADDWAIIIGAAVSALLAGYAPAKSDTGTSEQVAVGPGFSTP